MEAAKINLQRKNPAGHHGPPGFIMQHNCFFWLCFQILIKKLDHNFLCFRLEEFGSAMTCML